MLSNIAAPCRATSTSLPDIATSLPFIQAHVALLGQARLLAANSSTTGDCQLFVITLPGGSVEKLPLQDSGACVVAGADGCAYLGTQHGRLLRYDPAQHTLSALAAPSTTAQFTVGYCSADGAIYFGSTPGGMVARIQPSTGEVEYSAHCQPAPPHCCTVTAFVERRDGRVVAFCSGGPHAAVCNVPGTGAWEPLAPDGLAQLGEITHAVTAADGSVLVSTAGGTRVHRLAADTWEPGAPLPVLPDGDAVYCLRLAGETLLVSGLSGALYRYVVDGWERLGIPIPYDPLVFAILPDGHLAGLTVHGRLVQSSVDDRMFLVAPLPTRERNALTIEAMGMSPDRKLYFSFARNMRVGCWDPDDAEAIGECFIAAPSPGEVSALGFVGERLLLGVADACGVLAYYPESPYRLLENPRDLGAADTAGYRPLGPMVHHEQNVYFAAAGVTPDSTGIIVRLNPLENAVTAFHEIIPGENLTSLVADRLSGLLIAGGSRAHGMAHLACWSPYDTKTLHCVTPFPDASTLHVWAAEGGRIYVTDGGSRLALLSSEGAHLESGEFPLGAITSLITNQDGKLYGLAGGWFFHLDAERQQVERIVEATGSLLSEVRRGYFAYTHAGRIYTVQLW
jgi:hypothetical protein